MKAVACAVAIACLSTACGDDGASTEGTAVPRPVRARYSVSYADLKTPGTATVRYRLPSGDHVEGQVQIPWESRVLEFAPDADVFLTATAPQHPTANLQCDVITDQGPYGRTSGSSGQSSCDVDTNLAELAKRD